MRLLFTLILIVATTAQAQPNAAQYRANAQQYGRTHCEMLKQAPASYSDQHLAATYYDAQRVFFNIFDDTQDPYWNTCAAAAARVYRDTYAAPNGGNVPGYWNFTRGLALDFARNADALSRTAVRSLALNAAFCRDSTPENTADPQFAREVAYCILSMLDAERVGEPRRARLSLLIDHSLEHFRRWFTARDHYYKPFMVGLAAEALIEWHRISGDSRVLPALQAAAEQMYLSQFHAATNSLYYISEPVSFEDPRNPAPDLNMLIAHLYGWLYKQTGASFQKERGDRLFNGGVTGAYLVGGKQFNQSYRLGYAYLAAVATPSPTPTPTPTQTPSPTPTAAPTAAPTVHPCEAAKYGSSAYSGSACRNYWLRIIAGREAR